MRFGLSEKKIARAVAMYRRGETLEAISEDVGTTVYALGWLPGEADARDAAKTPQDAPTGG